MNTVNVNGFEFDRSKFDERVAVRPDGCWQWIGWFQNSGYGAFRIGGNKGKDIRAHRLSWILANGRPIPDGLVICHRCDNRWCVNPDHLFAGTLQDNIDDMVAKGRGRYVGSKPGFKRLTAEKVRWIRQSATGVIEMARSLGVSRTTVRRALAGLTHTEVA